MFGKDTGPRELGAFYLINEHTSIGKKTQYPWSGVLTDHSLYKDPTVKGNHHTVKKCKLQ